MWDSFLSGVAASIMLTENNVNGENEFAEMEYMNITFGLRRDGVHSGHVQTGLRDPFRIAKNGKGRCKDGYTAEVTGEGGVRVLVAVLNKKEQSGKFNFTKQFPHYKEVLYRPDLKGRQLGKKVVFDMDMSAGDFLALFYLLKLPVEVVDLKAIIVSPTGWANAATIDVVYDLLHMMGRDDIPVGLGDVFAVNQTDPIFSAIGDCKYIKAIPHGSGGFLDSDTLYGLARDLPRSPRRYTAENSVKFGAPRDTEHPELRQPLTLEIWQSLIESLTPGSKVTILTNGPLTNVAKIILSGEKSTSAIEEILLVGGHIGKNETDKGNVINTPTNKFAELNMFLDPSAAKRVFESGHKITLVSVDLLQDMFLGEILGAVILGGNELFLKTMYIVKNLGVLATGMLSKDGQITIDENSGGLVRVLDSNHVSRRRSRSHTYP
ncbi:hypothetical protein SASPL_112333 [Salvia splendens]|uniref:Inosine/uridine-preferring nucleoside hydrolase domain-containing protein n=1 Tax=Salvia splendens TaxID=180675 RepID=A0A8X9A5Z8_SALSN|nr:hypothetical protein SASPL_112333 [Salvia splendens]